MEHFNHYLTKKKQNFKFSKVDESDSSGSDSSDTYTTLRDDCKVLCEDDSDATLELKETLADMYLKDQRYNEASQLYDQIFKSYENILHKSSRISMMERENSTFALLKEDRLNESMDKLETMCESTLEDKQQENTMEEYDPLRAFPTPVTNTITGKEPDKQCIMLKRLVKEKDYEEALNLLINLWRTYVSSHGYKDERTLDVRVKIGNILYKQGLYDQCLELFYEIHNIYSIILGPDKPKTLKAKLMIAMSYMKQGDYKTSMILYNELRNYYGKSYGANSLQTIIVDVLIGKNLLRQGKKDQALQKYRTVYESYTKLLGPRHHDTVEIKHIIGHVLLQKGNVVEALVVFQDVFMTYVELYGYTDVNTLECKSSLASALLLLRKFDLSLQYFEEVYEQYKKVYGLMSVKTTSLKNVIDDLKKASLNAVSAGHDSIQKFLERYSTSGNSSGITETHSNSDSSTCSKSFPKRVTKIDKFKRQRRERMKTKVGMVVDEIVKRNQANSEHNMNGLKTKTNKKPPRIPLTNTTNKHDESETYNKACYRIKPFCGSLSSEHLTSSDTNISYSTLDAKLTVDSSTASNIRETSPTQLRSKMSTRVSTNGCDTNGCNSIGLERIKSSSILNLHAKDVGVYMPLKRSSSISSLSSNDQTNVNSKKIAFKDGLAYKLSPKPKSDTVNRSKRKEKIEKKIEKSNVRAEEKNKGKKGTRSRKSSSYMAISDSEDSEDSLLEHSPTSSLENCNGKTESGRDFCFPIQIPNNKNKYVQDNEQGKEYGQGKNKYNFERKNKEEESRQEKDTNVHYNGDDQKHSYSVDEKLKHIEENTNKRITLSYHLKRIREYNQSLKELEENISKIEDSIQTSSDKLTSSNIVNNISNVSNSDLLSSEISDITDDSSSTLCTTSNLNRNMSTTSIDQTSTNTEVEQKKSYEEKKFQNNDFLSSTYKSYLIERNAERNALNRNDEHSTNKYVQSEKIRRKSQKEIDAEAKLDRVLETICNGNQNTSFDVVDQVTNFHTKHAEGVTYTNGISTNSKCVLGNSDYQIDEHAPQRDNVSSKPPIMDTYLRSHSSAYSPGNTLNQRDGLNEENKQKNELDQTEILFTDADFEFRKYFEFPDKATASPDKKVAFPDKEFEQPYRETESRNKKISPTTYPSSTNLFERHCSVEKSKFSSELRENELQQNEIVFLDNENVFPNKEFVRANKESVSSNKEVGHRSRESTPSSWNSASCSKGVTSPSTETSDNNKYVKFKRTDEGIDVKYKRTDEGIDVKYLTFNTNDTSASNDIASSKYRRNNSNGNSNGNINGNINGNSNGNINGNINGNSDISDSSATNSSDPYVHTSVYNNRIAITEPHVDSFQHTSYQDVRQEAENVSTTPLRYSYCSYATSQEKKKKNGVARDSFNNGDIDNCMDNALEKIKRIRLRTGMGRISGFKNGDVGKKSTDGEKYESDSSTYTVLENIQKAFTSVIVHGSHGTPPQSKLTDTVNEQDTLRANDHINHQKEEYNEMESPDEVLNSFNSTLSPLLERKPTKRKLRSMKHSKSLQSVQILDDTQSTHVEGDTPLHSYRDSSYSNSTITNEQQQLKQNGGCGDTDSNNTEYSSNTSTFTRNKGCRKARGRNEPSDHTTASIESSKTGENSTSDVGSYIFENKLFTEKNKQKHPEGNNSDHSKLFEVKSLKKEESSSSAGSENINLGFEDSEGLDLWSDTSSMPYMKRSDRYKKLEAKYKLIEDKPPKKKYGKRKLLRLFCF